MAFRKQRRLMVELFEDRSPFSESLLGERVTLATDVVMENWTTGTYRV